MKDCNEEIADWMQYCPKHYSQVEQQKQESAIEQPEAQQPVQPPVEQPQDKPVEQPKPVEQQGQQQSYSPENKQVSPEPEPIPEVIDIVEKQPVTEENKLLPLDDLQGKDRLIIKQVAMKCAVEFLQQTPVEYSGYDEMVGQLRRLVVDMYRIIVEKNEQ